MHFEAINPATGELLQRLPVLNPVPCEARLQASFSAWQNWRYSAFLQRSQLLQALAGELRNSKDQLARLMATEMGKPLQEGLAEVEKSAWVCDYYAEQGPAQLKPQPVATEAHKSYVTYQPLGPILAIMPWNFPIWQVLRCSAPALMAGNAVLLKHAPNVPGCAAALETLWHAALQAVAAPVDLFLHLPVSAEAIPALIQRPEIQAVTLTGSTRAGRAVAAQAGAALKKTVLELGGSDPYLILADADLAAAARLCARSRLINAGQSCIAAKRLIVDRSVKAEFEYLLLAEMQQAVMGDPLHPATTLGPLARSDLRETLHHQVSQSLAAGARCLLGGELPPGPGWFYPATVLTDVVPGMPAFDEELFGPVAVVIAASDTPEAVRLANHSRYGLGAAVFSQNIALAEQIAAEQLQAGCAFVNDFVKSDPRLPFGGVRESGYGRELGPWGLHEFVNIKTVFVA
ncbi:MAG: NAD-dependent succinate-semialdehyde dehydrogenase [Candidatus Sericytochromatia bacterium]|nr:NAD-dependent succinate-semialdehyde dehydrogenase [Candidatus Sericytochromatia bacterium]